MLTQLKDDFISEQEYLAGERNRQKKYELINGEIYMMAGASRKHNLLSKNMLVGFDNQLKQKKSPCQVFSSDMKVRIQHNDNVHFYYPDVVIACDDDNDSNDYFTEKPKLIVEVLSSSTRKMDKTMKMQDYIQIPSLEEYILIEQSICEISVLRRANNWQTSVYFLGDDITFTSIGVTVAVEDIYYQVNNADINQYLATQALSESTSKK